MATITIKSEAGQFVPAILSALVWADQIDMVAAHAAMKDSVLSGTCVIEVEDRDVASQVIDHAMVEHGIRVS